jgi:putative transposase
VCADGSQPGGILPARREPSIRVHGTARPSAGVALEWPTYGSRRITAELRRGGLSVNRKRVQRLMREDNLLCLRKRQFVATTDSTHALKVYPNLAAALVVSGINQLWRADITYIRLLEEFVYLAVVLDAFSRRAIGWALESTLEAQLAVAALEMAFERRRPAPGLVHHSDQGVQYVSYDYVALLEAHQVRISMSRRGNPWDNAICESFMKTLKCEEVYRSEYRNLAEARARIGEFWRRSTTRSGCTRLWAISRLPSSNTCSRRGPGWWWPRHRRRDEFSKAWGNLSMR